MKNQTISAKIETMKQMLIKYIKTIFGDTRQAIVSLIVAALIGGYSGLLYLSKTVLELSLQLANIPIPLWESIALTYLCCLYIYIREKRSRATLTKEGQPLILPPDSQRGIITSGNVLSDMHDKILALLFLTRQPATIEHICSILKISPNEAKVYLHDLCNKKLINAPPPYFSGTNQWHINQNGRKYIMDKQKKEEPK